MFYTLALSACLLVNSAHSFVQSPVKGPLKGFNYNPGDDTKELFPLVKDTLPDIGAPGFASARLYTALDPDSNDDPKPHPAFKAAGDTGTTVLIGLACSLGDDAFDKEITALEAVLKDKDGTYGNLVSKNLIVGISVGNEDFYRQSEQGTPLAANLGKGSKPSTIIKQINRVRKTLSDQSPSLSTKIPVGHADTWTMWVNNDYGKKLLTADSDQDFQPIDFVGLQAFNYWQGYDIHNLSAFNTEALSLTKAAAGNIPVWVTETGWPVSGPKCCDGRPKDGGMPGQLAWPGKSQAQLYWQGVGCDTLFAGTGSNATNTWWYRIFASTDESANADGELNWKVLSKVDSDSKATPAFSLDCKAPTPTAPTPTSAMSTATGTAVSKGNSNGAGVTASMPAWMAVLPLLGTVVCSFV